jgi:hypothetical protein
MAGQMDSEIRAPLKIHFGVQANLFDSGRRQEKAALATAKADFPSLPESKNLLLAAQKQFFRATHKKNDVFTRIRIRGFVFFRLTNIECLRDVRFFQHQKIAVLSLSRGRL